jgi:hypothetical protein
MAPSVEEVDECQGELRGVRVEARGGGAVRGGDEDEVLGSEPGLRRLVVAGILHRRPRPW